MASWSTERAFEEAIECASLEHGPDACAGDATLVREATFTYGEDVPGGYRKVKWSRSFGQVEGFGKVYSGCEVKPSWSSCPANADKIPGRAWIVFR